ncbi:MAG: type I methionyl aminopeptidase [Candidatus Omnitrophica bacterium]|jgi:methionyl aminopeptidase|nr:type I methionyl aminopeptidase [Candidatus Omnitrophota bacterium]MDD5079117.1 type I methionyl aminopeptidase [Candidatus Omnitrophota bacterium]
MIPIKSESELELMRRAGEILAQVMHKVQQAVRPGITTGELDRLAEELIIENRTLPAFKGYNGYPAALCISINEQVVHGIPGERRLEDGDIASLDLGLNYQGYFSDLAVTVAVGKSDAKARKLVDTTRQSLNEGIKKAVCGNHLSDVSWAIQRHAEKNGFSVVRQFVGHGIGRRLHEEPEVANFGQAHRGPVLKSGMVLAIEPMINAGTWECEVLADGWTAVTKDGAFSAHFEHTVAVTEAGPQILTRL